MSKLGDGLLALGEITLCRRLRLAELGLGQSEELLVVLVQRLGGQLRKGTHHLLALLVPPGTAVRPPHAVSSSSSEAVTARALSPPTAAAVASCNCAVRLGAVGLGIAERAPRPCGPPPAGGMARQQCQTAPDAPTNEKADDHSEDHQFSVTVGCIRERGPGPPPGLRRSRAR